MKVICIKFTSGEEIIAKTVDSSSSLMLTEVAKSSADEMFEGPGPWPVPDFDITIEDVRIITIQQVGQGQVGIGFVPWAVGNPEGKITISKATIAAVYPPRDELEKGFLGQTSGLQIAGAGSLPKSPSTRM